MSKRESIARHALIIQKLRKHPATFDVISDYLALESEVQAYNYVVSKRTFQRDLDDIRSLYNIDIQFDFSRKVYYIDSDEQTAANERILEAFDTFNALNLADRLSDHIYFEKRRPQGTEYLYGLLHAIKNHFQVAFVYVKYGDGELTSRNVEPYALKEYNYRWYLLARDLGDQKIKSFSLDRFSSLEFSKKRFQFPEDFSVHQHYKHCFGIISPNGTKPEEIILSFDPFQGKYIKSLPLHESQEILIDNDTELRVKLTLYITHDLLMELLSYGSTLRVIAPESLVKEMRTTCENMLKHYVVFSRQLI